MTIQEFLDKNAKLIIDRVNKQHGHKKITKDQLIKICKELGWKE